MDTGSDAADDLLVEFLTYFPPPHQTMIDTYARMTMPTKTKVAAT